MMATDVRYWKLRTVTPAFLFVAYALLAGGCLATGWLLEVVWPSYGGWIGMAAFAAYSIWQGRTGGVDLLLDLLLGRMVEAILVGPTARGHYLALAALLLLGVWPYVVTSAVAATVGSNLGAPFVETFGVVFVLLSITWLAMPCSLEYDLNRPLPLIAAAPGTWMVTLGHMAFKRRTIDLYVDPLVNDYRHEVFDTLAGGHRARGHRARRWVLDGGPGSCTDFSAKNG